MNKIDNVFDWLQNWYKQQCDGDWEHEFGISIETVDNPGWYVTVNLLGTECEDREFKNIKFELNDANWYFCKIKNNNFEASCDPNNLTTILEIFRDWVES